MDELNPNHNNITTTTTTEGEESEGGRESGGSTIDSMFDAMGFEGDDDGADLRSEMVRSVCPREGRERERERREEGELVCVCVSVCVLGVCVAARFCA